MLFAISIQVSSEHDASHFLLYTQERMAFKHDTLIACINYHFPSSLMQLTLNTLFHFAHTAHQTSIGDAKLEFSESEV